MESLKDWLAKKKAMWGTCAGLILLSNNVLDWKNNGQSLVSICQKKSNFTGIVLVFYIDRRLGRDNSSKFIWKAKR